MIREYLELPLQVRILCLGSLVNRAGSFVLVFLTIYASEQLGFGVPFATACMGVLGLGSMSGALLGGQLADQIGRRVVMLASLFGGAAILAVLSSIQNRWAFMGWVGVFALITDMYRPAASAMIADLVDGDRQRYAFGLMYVSINLGFAIAPPLGGFLAEYSFQFLFWGDAVTMSLYGLIILFSTRETLGNADKNASEDEVIPESVSIQVAANHIARDFPFIMFCLSTLLMSLVFMQGMTTLPVYIRQSGFTNIQFGLLMSVNGMLIVLLQLPLTHWLAKFNAMSVVVVSGVLVAIGFGMNYWPGGMAFIALTICVWTIGEIIEAPLMQTIVSQLAPVSLRARYMGCFTLSYAFALTLGAPLGGQILEFYGPQALWSISFVVALAGVIGYAMIHGRVTDRTADQVS